MQYRLIEKLMLVMFDNNGMFGAPKRVCHTFIMIVRTLEWIERLSAFVRMCVFL